MASKFKPGLPTILTVVGLLLLIALVWVFGPYLGFGQAQPLSSVMARVITTLLIVIIASWIWWFRRWRAARKTEQLADNIAGQEDDGHRRQAGERDVLQQRFREAVSALKTASGGRRSLYELPWYAIVGPPGSGKSTLLLNSGLEFPLEGEFGREAVRGVGGTRSCDWWFTSEAVFLDTAGRFTTQDSDAGADKAAWTEFLKQLVRYRPRQPLNGVIVAVSAADLLTGGDQAVEQIANAVRRRIDELQVETGAKVPVYLVFTKLDLVAGFAEFFGDLNREQRAQVWGTTFPVEASLAGKGAQDFAEEFDLLLQRLGDRWLERVQREHDPRTRTSVFAFPGQIAALKSLTQSFVSRAFDSSVYAQDVVLRGVYLTSGTQEGTPVDRMLGALGRTFGIDVAAESSLPAQAKTFFVERLLREVLIPEAGIAGTHPQVRRRRTLLRVAGFAGIGVLALLAVVLLLISHGRNQAYLDDVAAAVAAVPDDKQRLKSAPLRHIADQLGALRRLEAVASRNGEGAPLTMRWGLSQVDATAESAAGAYSRALSSQLLPVFANHLRERMIETASEPGVLYEYLRAYLMLAEPKRLDPDFLGALAEIEWQRIVANDKTLRQELKQHFQTLLQQDDGFPPINVDQRVVAASRQTLLRASLAQLAYGRLQGTYAAAEWPPLILEEAIGIGAANVFQRKSGLGLDAEVVPPIFTQEVFQSVVAEGLGEVVGELMDDVWIFGDEGKRLPSKDFLEQQTLAVYERDYISQWRLFLDDLQLRPTARLAELQEQLYLLTSLSSPMRNLLGLVRDNTLIEVEDEESHAATVGERLKNEGLRKSREKKLGRILGPGSGGSGPEADPPGTAITTAFESLHKLVEGPPGAAPVDGVLRLLTTYRDRLNALGANPGASVGNALGGGAGDIVASVEAEAKRWPAPVAGWLEQLVGKGTEISASLVRTGLSNSFEQAVGAGAKSACRGRYPFAGPDAPGMPLQDFARLFAHGGSYDSFFQQQIKSVVDTSRPRWRWRPGPGGQAPGSTRLLREIQAALDIRDAFFANGSARAAVPFVLHLEGGDVGQVELVMGDKVVTLVPNVAASVETQWPHGSLGGFRITTDTGQTMVWEGPWAIFKALDSVPTNTTADGRLSAQFQVGDQIVPLVFEPTSLKNPFTQNMLKQFRCG